MKRITQKDLEAKAHRLNVMTGIKKPGYNVKGCYVIDYAYGGAALHRYTGDSGGVNDVLQVGYPSKSELFRLISAYEYGLMDCK